MGPTPSGKETIFYSKGGGGGRVGTWKKRLKVSIREGSIVMEERKDGRVEHWWGMEEGKI